MRAPNYCRLAVAKSCFIPLWCCFKHPAGSCEAPWFPRVSDFAALRSAQIDAYLDKEQAYDCAGSAKSEGLGIALLEEISGSDPTALIGLPLITVVSMLKTAGVEVLR